MIVLALVLYLARHSRSAFYCLGLTLAATAVAYLLKVIVHVPRPNGLLDTHITYSFPSGHMTLSIAFYGFIAMLLLKTLRKPAYRKMIYYSYATLLCLICFSRLYLGAHWLSDILGGLLLGGLCFFIMKVLYYREPSQNISPKLIIITSLLSLAVFWAAYFTHAFKQQLSEYQQVAPDIIMSQQNWWQGNGKSPLLYRTDRFGHPKEALNIQWAGQLDDIETLLNEQGWQSIQKFYWSDLLHPAALAQRVSVAKILPQLFRNNAPQAIFIRRLADKQVLSLILWDTQIRLSPQQLPLWVGLLRYQQVYENEQPLPMPSTSPTTAFSKQLPGLSWKIVKYPTDTINGHRLALADKLLLIAPQGITHD